MRVTEWLILGVLAPVPLFLFGFVVWVLFKLRRGWMNLPRMPAPNEPGGDPGQATNPRAL
jgi:hypothetical protein